MNQNHDIAWPSITRIQKETGLSRPTVIKYIDELEERQFLRRDKASRASTTYIAMFPKNFEDRLNSLTSKGGLLVKELNRTSKGALPEVVKELYPNKQENITKNKTNEFLSLINDGFDHWWSLYPSSRRKNKKGCLTKFKAKCKKLNEDEIESLVNFISVDIQKRISELDDIKYMPMTEPYLNQERWNDGQ
jgi:DNA-binding Lrp family transcriptional regulator